MPAIYRLSPLDHADPSWAASTHKGECIVRANSEDQARDLAHGAFWIGVAKPRLAVSLVVSPWKNPAKVRAEVIERAPFRPEGKAEILVPSDPAGAA